jgi:glycosyltransferase involved in cell wall biosynthesis
VEIAKRYPVTIVQEKRQGIVFARNCGFNKASGEVFVRCDADTIYPSHFLRTIDNHFSRYPYSAITGPVFYNDFKFFGWSRAAVMFYAHLVEKILGHHFLRGQNTAVTRMMWQKVKNNLCFDGYSMHEDVDLSIHLSKQCRLYFNDQLYVYGSGRRAVSSPYSFYVKYPLMFINTLIKHY